MLSVLLVGQIVYAQTEPAAVTAWFTQARIENSVQAPKPADALPSVPGTAGEGVRLTKPVAIENPLLKQSAGLITFWIKPNWNGNDGKTHKIMRIGDPETNGLLVEKSSEGMLRFVMASSKKTTSSRADVSGWKAGQWHQVAIAWFSLRDKPLGLPLWIDKVAVAGPIAGGNEFLNPDTMKDKRLWIGDSTSDAVMDELIIRDRFDTEKPAGQMETVYRDYFRCAPYTKIKIEPNSCRVPSDRRVVNGCPKQFGLQAGSGKWMELVTDNEARYHPWSEFDAKPLIKWTTSDESVATVDENGRVTGRSIGKCKLTAEYRGMTDAYDLEVIPIDQPDLDLLYVEMLPNYSSDAEKDRPDVGETMRSVAHISNFGYENVPAGAVVRFEMIPDKNHNYSLDDNEKPVKVEEQTIARTLAPRENETVTFSWTWPADPMFIRVTVDPKNAIPEICEANNQMCDLNTARPAYYAYNPKQLDGYYKDRQINHVGSFSEVDWINAEKLRFNLMLKETVLPETSPNGIEDSFRTERFYEVLDTDDWTKQPYEIERNLYDAGFPVNEPIDTMSLDIAIIHEFGHTCASLPDLYGYPQRLGTVFLKDGNGEPYEGSDLMPNISIKDQILPYSSAFNIPCGSGYDSLMCHCHLWLNPANAGQIQWFKGFRGSRFWGTQGHLIPTREYYFKVYDINDEPLKGAAIYIYHVSQTETGDAGTKYISDRPKFMGNTDGDGRYRMPENTDPTWDDPDTDEVDGEWAVWNPFGRVKTDTAFTPNVSSVEGLLLVKVVSGDQTEFALVPMTEFNAMFFRGDRIRGTADIRTSLKPTTGVTPVVKPVIPDAISEKNLRPVAVAELMEMTVKCGEEFTIDGSKSYDPEGQPLIYRWAPNGDWLIPDLSQGPTLTMKAPNEPGEKEYRFYVLDGLRASEPVVIKVKVE